MRRNARWVSIVAALWAFGCAPRSTRVVPRATPVYTAEIVARFAHDPDAFTQGLEFHDGLLFESTGLHGHSSVRAVEPATGHVVRSRPVAAEHFAEGLTVFNGRVYQLTLDSGRCFVYDPLTLEPITELTFAGDGWGLTHDARSLILSDGTDTLRFMDPTTFAEQRRVRVVDGAAGVERLNELEMVDGELFANVWHTDRIARIEPSTGRVLAWIDLRALRPPVSAEEPEAVLNGIAFEPSTHRLLVTGKLWPEMFEIRLRAL